MTPLCRSLLAVIAAAFGADAFAATAENAAPPQSSVGEVITLGTAGGPLPRADRTQSSNLLVINGSSYLVDAGDNVTRRIVQAHVDFRTVGKVFITHPHSDHVLGLPTLLVSEWEFQRRDPIEIVGPPGVEATVRGLVNFVQPNTDIRWAEGKKSPLAAILRARDVEPGLVYRDNNVAVTAVENSHFHFAPGTPPFGKNKSYSYRFQIGGKAVVFTGDTGPSHAVERLASGADILVSEVLSVEDTIDLFKANGVWETKTPAEREGIIRHFQDEHLTPRAVGELAARAGVKMVILTHLPPTKRSGAAFADYVEQIRTVFDGRVVVANDLDRFPL